MRGGGCGRETSLTGLLGQHRADHQLINTAVMDMKSIPGKPHQFSNPHLVVQMLFSLFYIHLSNHFVKYLLVELDLDLRITHIWSE